MEHLTLYWLIIIGCLVSAASAYIGSFMVIKRMSLVGDALSHVALPGMAVALSFNLSPIIGAFISLFFALLVVWYLQETTSIYTEALVGVLFTVSLALGVIIAKDHELLEALFGSIENITLFEGILVSFISIILIIIVKIISPKLLISIISDEIARSLKMNLKLINLVYLMLVGAIVAAGVMFVGTLLVGALVIIPAVSARNIAKNLKQYFIYSVIFGLASSFLGISFALMFSEKAGPLVVIVSFLIFLTTYLVKLIFGSRNYLIFF